MKKSEIKKQAQRPKRKEKVTAEKRREPTAEEEEKDKRIHYNTLGIYY